MSSDGDIDYWYAKGQRDYPDNWDPPINDFNMVLTNFNERDIEQMIAYKAGWENARKQA